MSRQPHTVIVGAGFGGLRTARKLVSKGFPVTLIDRRSYHLFTPLLYQVATGSLGPSEIAVPVRSVFRGKDSIECLMGTVMNVHFDDKQVEMENGDLIPFDYLVIAAGAQSHYFGNEEEWHDKVYTLDDIESAEALRDRFLVMCERAEREPDAARRKEMLTVAVIGAGPSGVELAGAISDLTNRTLAQEYHRISPGDVRVILYEAVDRVLPVFDEKLSESAKRQLEELDVEVVLSTPVDSVEEDAVVAGDQKVKCGLICWGSGVRPANLAQCIDSPKQKGKLVVDEYCALPEHPYAFAVGDIAHFEGDDGNPLPGLAPVALQQGSHVAKTIVSESKGRRREPFGYNDRGLMATIGRSRAVAQSGSLKISGMLAWLAWVFLHVMYLVGFRTRLLVFLEWLWAYVGIGTQRGNRLIHAEEPAPKPPQKNLERPREPMPSHERAAFERDQAASV